MALAARRLDKFSDSRAYNRQRFNSEEACHVCRACGVAMSGINWKKLL
jgi:hypothetical protein